MQAQPTQKIIKIKTEEEKKLTLIINPNLHMLIIGAYQSNILIFSIVQLGNRRFKLAYNLRIVWHTYESNQRIDFITIRNEVSSLNLVTRVINISQSWMQDIQARKDKTIKMTANT